MRTTVDIDDPILRDLKKLQKTERKSLGRLVSDLLAHALREKRATGQSPRMPLRWISKPMGARIDLTDQEALYSAIESRRTGKERQ